MTTATAPRKRGGPRNAKGLRANGQEAHAPKGRKKAAEANEPIEKQLWKAADKLRKNIDAAEYKHIVLGQVEIRGLRAFLCDP